MILRILRESNGELAAFIPDKTEVVECGGCAPPVYASPATVMPPDLPRPLAVASRPGSSMPRRPAGDVSRLGFARGGLVSHRPMDERAQPLRAGERWVRPVCEIHSWLDGEGEV